MDKEKWEQEIEQFTFNLKAMTAQHREDTDYRSTNRVMDWQERQVLERKFCANRKKLEGKIKYRENKIAMLGGTPEHTDIFGQVFKVGCRVAWSSSGRYARPYLGWVVKITAKQVSVSTTHAFNATDKFDPDAYGTSLMPSSLIICDAIVEALT